MDEEHKQETLRKWIDEIDKGLIAKGKINTCFKWEDMKKKETIRTDQHYSVPGHS